MNPALLLEATLILLLLITKTVQCLVLALVAAAQLRLHAAWNTVQEEVELMPRPLASDVEHSIALFTRPVQETQHTVLQAVGGLGVAQESLHQRNLPAVMVPGIRCEVS